jgi:TetR/AcrR family transcriptional regulator
MQTTNTRETAPKAIGRPVDADSEQTRSDILNAAERLFAEQGFAGTSIRQIAEEVGVNSAMVHYYFGKKPQLMHAVLTHVLEPLADGITSMGPGTDASLSDIVKMFIGMSSRHPNLPRLVVREVLLPGGQMREVFIKQFAPRLGGALPGIFRTQQQAGKITPDVDPSITALMLISLCFFPFLAKDLASQALDIRYDDEGLEKLQNEITGLLERGLQTGGKYPEGIRS